MPTKQASIIGASIVPIFTNDTKDNIGMFLRTGVLLCFVFS